MKSLSATINPYIGQRIRLERKRLGLSQETLASELNVSANYVGEIERGKRVLSLNMAEKFCGYFHFTLDYLYRGITPGVIAEQFTREADPHRELMQMMEACSDQELRLCLDIVRPVLVIWRSNTNTVRTDDSQPAYRSCSDSTNRLL